MLEQQIIVTMNMIPNKDFRHAQKMFSNENFDFLGPLEILNGNSLCNFKLNKTNYIKNQLENYEIPDEKSG